MQTEQAYRIILQVAQNAPQWRISKGPFYTVSVLYFAMHAFYIICLHIIGHTHIGI